MRLQNRGVPRFFCCLIIAKFPRAWDGKAEARCTIRVNHPGGENYQWLRRCCNIPSCIPRAARGLSRVFRVEPQTHPGHGCCCGEESLPSQRTRRDAARPRWSFAVIFKANCYRLIPRSPCSCSPSFPAFPGIWADLRDLVQKEWCERWVCSFLRNSPAVSAVPASADCGFQVLLGLGCRLPHATPCL